MTHEDAIAKLLEDDFEWGKEAIGHAIESDRCLTRNPACCHGWIEIAGEPGLIGPVVMRVDEGFPLRFPSFVDLVARLGEP